ncbi:hypothetical protein TNCV_2965651 [Trichonephila clavipes]|nr:hypothetical protein TNCV_2965651 [Trichonephila clavipes]
MVRVSKSYINIALKSCRQAIGDRPLSLNHGQVTRMTPEMAPPSPNFHATPTGGHLSVDVFNRHQPPLKRRVFSGNRLELVTR